MRFLIILVVLVVIVAGAVWWADAAWDEAGPAARAGNQTVVLIPSHSRTNDVARLLEGSGVVKNALLFEFDARLRGYAGLLKAGEYAIPSTASMGAIASILASGKSIEHKLTVAEGLTSDMVWKLVEKDSELMGDAGPVPKEGTLLPETYLFTRGETRAHLLARMSAAQTKFLDVKWPARASGSPAKSLREAITLASIVEKESALPEERRHIASVFVNRLKMGMKLQSDPTIIYDISRGYPLGRGIRQSELGAATPYNTYVIAGLPPGPICNPGKDSLDAVLNPEQTSDLYFVATGKGGHVFSATVEGQARNVAAYRAFERQQQGSPESREVQAPGGVASTNVTILDPSAPKLPQVPARRKRAGHSR
jgi:UPF0755 protein